MAGRRSRQAALIIVPMLHVGMPVMVLCVTSVPQRNVHALHAAAAGVMLFNRDGTDDAECDVSDG
ncbi:hypothetical protein B0A91_17140 [Pseudomonas syringae]|uniref:Uncharacterized protein n=1 Tax=Pseudomonas syringae TaxID=317 RepID=A0A6B2AUN2_PSESX|nr:hypothetical protein [Pseudomonas syringae]NAO41967.1 hypothetical protein [Pseudomonas syringae]NAO46591.1 hypothetical protein [Pseudomonas syringae]NAO60150.1 hypothetical protein [Pseudomonas syringae]NAO69194.1 hypothetical protein [Pseudomonas syringae]